MSAERELANELEVKIEAAAERQYLDHRINHSKRIDKVFAGLFVVQWVVAIIMAYYMTPKTWAGTASSTHIHVYMAVVLGGLATLFPLFFV